MPSYKTTVKNHQNANVSKQRSALVNSTVVLQNFGVQWAPARGSASGQ